MRKVPNYIREHLECAKKHSQKMTDHIQAVENWITAQGLDPEDFRRGDGRGLEEIELGMECVGAVMHMLAVQGTPDDDLYDELYDERCNNAVL